ncbi:MAG TPA: rRNA adenine N-6-methyltransferase family protein, partial [Candidatus Paceibacterota bacterium]|nr:rRNA adenine N-6-methyltransferase family protein [Candidatus Paceibacterota bacterium]
MKAQKKLGQNFLINKNALKKIVGALEISDNDIIIEIGAGTGNLTQEILKKTSKVIAIEKDKSLVKL